MCGIAGLCAPGHEVPFGPWFADAVEQARHRGPDADGWWVPGMDAAEPLFTLADDPLTSTEVALGFLRLAILDLSPTGNQPMLSGDRLALAFNGEIYNYIELRAELAAMGYQSRSTGDSEVILHAWDAWGFEALPRLEGMFAIALWDRERHGLLLARDRFGEKPLFWMPYEDGIAFASEVKQLAAMPNVTLRLDPTRAAAFLASGRPFDGASSWFEGIHQLEPGTWLWIDADGIKQGRYHDLAAEVALVEPASSPDEWAARFASALADSVRLRLRSDVPVGTSLSAGVDSSAVMAEATALGHIGYHSFTLGSDDPRIDERDEARAFAAEMRSVWHEVVADPAGFAEVWDRLTWHQEAPVAGTSLYGQWRVQEAARAAGVIVMLDGHGADEVLGGYHKFFAGHVLRTAARRPWAAPAEGARFLRHVGGPRAVFRDGYRYLGRAGRAPDLGPLLTVPLPSESAPSSQAACGTPNHRLPCRHAGTAPPRAASAFRSGHFVHPSWTRTSSGIARDSATSPGARNGRRISTPWAIALRSAKVSRFGRLQRSMSAMRMRRPPARTDGALSVGSGTVNSGASSGARPARPM